VAKINGNESTHKVKNEKCSNKQQLPASDFCSTRLLFPREHLELEQDFEARSSSCTQSTISKAVKGLYYLVTKNMQEMYHTDQSTNL